MGQVRLLLPIWAGLTLLLLWPAIVNGGPILFYDTLGYLSAGKAAVGWAAEVIGRLPAEALQAVTGADGMAVPPPELPPESAPELPREQSGANRSIYYAVFVRVAVDLAGLWAVPLIQAGVFATALLAALAAWLPGRPVAVAAIGAVTAGLTGAPFFTSYVMPDFLAGLTVLALVRLMLPPAPGRVSALLWTGLLYAALVAHMSHLLVALGLFACACLAVTLARLPWPRRGARLAGLTLCLAIASELLFGYAVERVFGAGPLRPPFLAARMIEDGPGMRYLDHVCPPIPVGQPLSVPLAYDSPPPFELCRYRHRLPQSSLTILWDTRPQTGVYGAATSDSRHIMSDQHLDFAIGVLGHAPMAQIGTSLARFGEQLVGFSLEEFPYPDSLRGQLAAHLPPGQADTVRQSRFYTGTFGLRTADLVSRAVTIAAATALLVLFAHSLRTRAGRGQAAHPASDMHDQIRTLQVMAVLILLGLLGNAAVTGVLSAPHDRYQARIYWLLPCVAGIFWAHRPVMRMTRRVPT